MKIALVFALCLFCIQNLFGQQPTALPQPEFILSEKSWLNDISVVANFTIAEKYLAGRISRVLADEPIIIDDITVTYRKKFFFQIINYNDLDTDFSDRDGGDEMQLWCGIKFPVGEYQGKLSAGYFNLYPAESFHRDRFCASVSFARSFDRGDLNIKPELTLDYLTVPEKFGNGAFFFRPSVQFRYKEPFGIKKLAVCQQIGITWDGGLLRSDPGIFFNSNSSLEWKLGKNCTLVAPSFRLLEPITDQHDGRLNASCWSAGLRFEW